MDTPLALVIEDDDSLSDIFSKAVELAGFKTEIIQNGAIAIERLNIIVPAFVLLDMHLPQVSGRKILRHIRADPRLSKTYVIVASADAAMAQSLEEEADLVLIKPVSFRQLRDLASRFRKLC